MATVASLIVEISANASKLNKHLNSAKSRIQKFAKNSVKILKSIAKGLTAGAVVAIGAVTVMVNKYAAQIDKLAKTSSKLGVTIASLQKLQYQAELSGVSVETMNMALQRMVRRVSEAASGTGAAKDALRELRLDADKLNQLSPDKQFYEISKAMKQIGNQGDKVRLAMKIFDTEGVSLVNTMNSNLKQTGAEFDTLGLKISESQAKMVESYQDSKTKLGAIFSGFGLQLSAQFAEPLTMLINGISDAIIKMGGMKAVANKVALSIVQSFRGVINIINDMIKGINQFELLSKKAALKGAEHKGAIGSFFGGDDNSGNIQRINKEIADLEKPIKSLAKIDDFIAEMERKIKDNTGADLAEMKIRDNAVQSYDKAASATTKLAESATKASNAISPSASKRSNVIDFGDMSSRIKANQRNLNFDSPYSGFRGNNSQGAFRNESLNGGNVGSVQDYINSSSSGSALQKMRQGQFGSNSGNTSGFINGKAVDSGPSTKITLNMVTDAGEVSGVLLGDQEFINKISQLQERNTNNAARMAAQ
jgi:hypothetical protein